MTFDQVLPSLLSLCQQKADFERVVQRACSVRDLRGRVRLVLEKRSGCDEEAFVQLMEELEQDLATALQGFFSRPILTCEERTEGGRLAKKLLDQAEGWEPTFQDPITGDTARPRQGLWSRVERRLSKEAWLDRRSSGPPWKLDRGQPAIVTFYSFKGGVGRTTALVSCAWQIARSGRRVVVVDLDLEAPGLGVLLGSGSRAGVLDAIVDFLATERVSLQGLHAPAQALGANAAANVEVFPAGDLNESYLEKLARLDFVGSNLGATETDSPVEKALRNLLHRIRGDLRPDFILIDARAGLHDLAGLSLHGLAHVDVLVSRATEQGYAGLNVTIQALGRRREPRDLSAVVVHAMAPQDRAGEPFQAELAEFLDRSYQIFSEWIYEVDSAPGPDVDTAIHYPWSLRFDPGLERFTSLASVEENLLGQDYERLWRRIEELCYPAGASESDEDG